MNIHDANRGALVKITGIKETTRIYQSGIKMREMVGKTFTIDDIRNKHLMINSYHWAACDVELVSTIKIPKVHSKEKFHFDVNLLNC